MDLVFFIKIRIYYHFETCVWNAMHQSLKMLKTNILVQKKGGRLKTNYNVTNMLSIDAYVLTSL